jgi:hypothetical protein
MVGGLNGQIKGDRHLVLPDLTPSANAMLTIGHKFGLEADTFGVSNGLVDL